MTQGWFVRAGREDEYEQLDLEEGMVAVKWNLVGDLATADTKEAINERVASAYPGVSRATVNAYAIQLHVLRNVMQQGDLVVLLRSKAPEVAIGTVSGEYAHRAGRETASHMRPVRWLLQSVRRSDIGPDLLDPPALSVVYRIAKESVVERLAKMVGRSPSHVAAPSTIDETEVQPATGDARANLTSNLNYARNLTTAGSHLEQLKVGLFEVTDVYRAAWVQAVAAIDHWVHQEVYDRMLRLCDDDKAPRPDRYKRFELSLEVLEQIQAGKSTKHEAVEVAMKARLGYQTFQKPQDIRDAFGYVADVTNLWQRVAMVLNERADAAQPVSGKDVQDLLREIVLRRNKIAHEYDEDPFSPPSKRTIDSASTMQTIEWLDQLAAALLVVLDQE